MPTSMQEREHCVLHVTVLRTSTTVEHSQLTIDSRTFNASYLFTFIVVFVGLGAAVTTTVVVDHWMTGSSRVK